ncbi:MAG TPA: metal-dependent hydrolase [Candidatus Manganitrophaceae bacterium]|nr:metal-dependent hydrolase [Candidatus Manganitrophaceae bacterium]
MGSSSMVIGHYAVGFAAKKLAPRASLAVLIGSAIFLDILWISFVVLGWERVRLLTDKTAFIPFEFEHYPYSHSLLTAIGWAALFALAYKKITGYSVGATLIGVGVLSHWILDLIVHRPDLPLYPGGNRFVGFHLWEYQSASLIFEGSLFILGLWIYVRQTCPLDRAGNYGFWIFILLLVGLYLGKLTGLPIGNNAALVIFGLVTWLSIPWAGWIERRRAIRKES